MSWLIQTVEEIGCVNCLVAVLDATLDQCAIDIPTIRTARAGEDRKKRETGGRKKAETLLMG
jgi:hypothetical protein